jgi:hypothetical protein
MRAVDVNRERQRHDHYNGDDEEKFGTSQHVSRLRKRG